MWYLIYNIELIRIYNFHLKQISVGDIFNEKSHDFLHYNIPYCSSSFCVQCGICLDELKGHTWRHLCVMYLKLTAGLRTSPEYRRRGKDAGQAQIS
jgi:hypothetical protein